MSDSTVKLSELRTKTRPELLEELTKLRAELSQLRTQKVAGANPAKLGKLRVIRKNIAQVLTIYNHSLRKDVLTTLKKNGHRKPLDLRPRMTRSLRNRLTPRQAGAVTVREGKKLRHNPVRKFAIKS